MTSSGSSSTRVWGQRPGQPGGSTRLGANDRPRRGPAVSALVAVLALLAAAVVLSALAGCAPATTQQSVTPQVKPPAIKQAGTLKAGVDLAYPPFGGVDQGRNAGLDVDVASALAEKLGLKLVIVDIKPSEAASALADGRADVVLSVPYEGEWLTRTSLQGTYVADGPALFRVKDASQTAELTSTAEGLPVGLRYGVQEGSPAVWTISSAIGTDTTTPFSTLREALTALGQGQVDVVAGDALVGAYIARDIPKLEFATQLGPAVALGVAVSTSNLTLGEKVRAALDELAADGVLDALRTKWVGQLPVLELAGSADSSASLDASASAVAATASAPATTAP
jgi:ABC-type amino acid transport substrate-binding protein